MNDLERLTETLTTHAATPHALKQFAVLAASLVIGAFLSRLLRARLDARPHYWKFGEGGFHRVAFPLIALACVGLGRVAMRSPDPMPVLEVATTLLIAYAVIRSAVYVLRHILPDGAFLRGSERTIAWTMWLGVALEVTGLLAPILTGLDAIEFNLGRQRLSLLLILQAIVSVAVTLAISMWIARTIEGRVLEAQAVELSTRVVIAKLVRAFAFFAAILVALPIVGIDITVLSVFGGALGVGLGLGLQKIASNYVSGFIILLDRSIRIGDLITVDGRHGIVTEIASRFTVIKSLDGVEAIIPNDSLITQAVVSHSYTDRRAAVKVLVPVAQDADLEAVSSLLVAIGKAHPRALADPAPGASITRITENGIEFELAVWIGDPELGSGGLRSDLLRAALDGLRERGIALAPPMNVARVG